MVYDIKAYLFFDIFQYALQKIKKRKIIIRLNKSGQLLSIGLFVSATFKMPKALCVCWSQKLHH